MKPALQRRIQRYGWDKAASFYSKYWDAQLAEAHETVLAAAQLKPGERVLDVACGNGQLSLPAAKAVGLTGSVLGLDISQSMVDTARDRAGESEVPNVTFDRCDAEGLNVEEASFDVVICSLGLMYVPSPRTALQQMFGALAPGGRIAVSIWGERRKCGWAGVFPVVDSRVVSEVCPMFFSLGTPEAIDAELEEAGFSDVESSRFETELEYVDAAEALGAALLGGAVALAYQGFDDDTRAEADTEYLETIHPYLQDDGSYRIPGEFVFASATRP